MARQVYNDTWASGGDKVDPGGVKTTQGWVVEAPPHEFFNFWQGRTDEMLQHFERNGIAVYDNSTVYDLGGFTREGTVVYRSLVVSNTGNLPSTSPAEWVQAFLIPGNNLSDLPNVATARTNLDVYSKAESDSNFLDSASNLSDLTNTATARTNLDVYSKAESDSNFLDESSNLSDLPSIATARTNLDVYSKAESDSNFLDSASNLSDLNNTSTARTNLDVYSTGEVLAGFVDQDSETGAANLPVGSTAQRPVDGAGKIRYNTSLSTFEGNEGSTWVNLASPDATESVKGIAEIATQTEVNSGTDDTRIVTSLKLQEKIDGNCIGVDQTWQDLTGSRSLGVVYTNSTGKPIQVIFLGTTNITYSVDIGLVYTYVQTNNNVVNSFIIPEGVSYEITGAGGSVKHWFELR